VESETFGSPTVTELTEKVEIPEIQLTDALDSEEETKRRFYSLVLRSKMRISSFSKANSYSVTELYNEAMDLGLQES
jgi:hypothetical protein